MSYFGDIIHLFILHYKVVVQTKLELENETLS